MGKHMSSHARKQVEGGVKRIPEPDRKNLELLYSANIQTALMLATVALTISVMALLAFYQIPLYGPIIYLAILGIVFFFIVPKIRDATKKSSKISKKLGCEESFKKYVEHDPK